MTAKANIYIDQGADFSVEVQIFNSEEEPLSVANTSFYSDIRKVYSETSIGSFDVVKNTTTIDLTMTANNTVNLPEGKYQYDVLMVNEDTGDVFKILEGLAFVVSTVTRI